jgi:hypothetical protein
MRLQLRADQLDEREKRLLEAILQGESIPDASLTAGYTQRTTGYVVLRRPRVQRALHEYRQRVINTEGATLALRTMIELMGPKVPAGTRFNAAKTILALAGHRVGDDDEGREKDLHEMDEDELRQFIARAQKVIDEGGEPPVIHLIEASDAQPGHIPPGGMPEEGEE